MKRKFTTLLFLLTLSTILSVSTVTLAQAPPPPPDTKGATGNKAPGGGAPLTDSLIIVCAMVGAFGAWKMLKIAKKKSAAGH